MSMPPPAQPPFMPAPAPQPKKSNKTLLIVLGVLGGVILLCCGGGLLATALSGDKKPTSASADQSPAADAPPTDSPAAVAASSAAPAAPAADKTARIGSRVRDGKFEFVVKTVKCGVSKVGSEYFNAKAQGQFCLVTMTVKNIGDESRTFDAGNQIGFGAGDTKYDADSSASLYANEDGQSFLTGINPGNSVTATVVFDIPKGAKLTRLELHDSMFSGGVTVKLT